ncbi:hypothetical protein BJV78DRAFT_1259770, partial [Lactifluus subvellereus]
PCFVSKTLTLPFSASRRHATALAPAVNRFYLTEADRLRLKYQRNIGVSAHIDSGKTNAFYTTLAGYAISTRSVLRPSFQLFWLFGLPAKTIIWVAQERIMSGQR